MKILLIGTGAVEQLLAESLMRSAHAPEVGCLTTFTHPGLRRAATTYVTVPTIDALTVERTIAETQPTLIIVGPSVRDAAITEMIERSGIPQLGPTSSTLALARPAIPRKLLADIQHEGNPTFVTIARTAELSDEDLTRSIHATLTDFEEGFAIQSDDSWGSPAELGEDLAGIADGARYALRALASTGRVTLDERREGIAFSVFFVADGATLTVGPAYTRALRMGEGEHGPLTAGVGVVVDATGRPVGITPAHLAVARAITDDVLQAFQKSYAQSVCGVFAGDFRLTAMGVELVCYRAGWGDPDGLAVLPLLGADLIDLAHAIAAAQLAENPPTFARRAVVGKYVTPTGYPRFAEADQAVVVYGMPMGCRLAYDAVQLADNATLRTTTGRIAACIGVADTINEAESAAESGTTRIEGSVTHRRDIGTDLAATQQLLRIDHLHSSTV